MNANEEPNRGRLEEFYGADEAKRYSRKLQRIIAEFHQYFPGSEPIVIRVPGRVNLIGEHTDYNGLPVFPMAINLEVLCVCSHRVDNKIHLVNNERFPEATFTISENILKSSFGSWDNYPKAAAQTLSRYMNTVDPSVRLKGFNGFISSTIPPGAGLSSSSALVVSVAQALSEVNHLSINKLELAELLAEGERYVGVQGGGMDQTVILNAERNCALLIDFYPLRIRNVPFPDDYSVIICNSKVVAEKSATQRNLYNRRTVECRLGTNMLKQKATGSGIHSIVRLGDFDPERASVLLEKSITKGSYSLDEICGFCRQTRDQIVKECMTLEDGSVFNDGLDSFKIKSRCQHVLSEGIRVRLGLACIERGDMKNFGQLMNESHQSCDLNYEVSTPELNQLVSICRSAGALGSRLTGAGFGGSVISLVKHSLAKGFLTDVAREYYEKYLKEKRPELFKKGCDPYQEMQVVIPSEGASRIQ